MASLQPDPKNRSFLLPPGCKDLNDLLQMQQAADPFPEWSRERMTWLAVAARDLAQTPLTQEQRGRVYAMLVHSTWMFLRAQRRHVSAEEEGARAVEFAEGVMAQPDQFERLLKHLLF